MEVPRQPADEEARLVRLRSLALLDSAPDERFDRITRLAARLFDVPVAAVMLVDADREWPLSIQGQARESRPRQTSLSAHALQGTATLVLPDVQVDARFAAENPSASGTDTTRFFAGAPLRLRAEGSALGTLCLMDRWPRAFAAVDEAVLRDLADLVERELHGVLFSLSDGSTGLCNRLAFGQLGQQALMMCARAHAPAAFLSFELDVAAASAAPDDDEPEAAARQFARLLRASFRATDVLARLSTRRFAALVTHCSEPYLRVVVERLQKAVQMHNQNVLRRQGAGPELHFRVAVRALMPTAQSSLEQLMQAAQGADDPQPEIQPNSSALSTT